MDSGVLEGFRLSPTQQHAWALMMEQQIPLRSVAVISIQGSLDPDRLLGRLKDIVAKYEILQVHFRALSGMAFPLQVIHPNTFELVDSTLLQMHEPTNLVHVAHSIPLDPETGPTFGATLIRHAADHYTLLVAALSVCLDSRSFRLLIEDLAHIYDQPDQLNEAELQFLDVAEWQHELLQDPDTFVGRQYWQEQDLSFWDQWVWPVTWQAAGRQSSGKMCHAFSLTAVQDAHVKQLCEDHTLDPQTFYLNLWLAFLARITQQADIPAAVLVDGRNYDELTSTIGLLARYVPMLTRLDLEQSIIALASDIQQTYQKIYQWQECFSWELVGRSLDTQPPFGFHYETLPHAIDLTESCWSVTYDIQVDAAHLLCRCEARSEGCSITLESDRAVIDETAFERIFTQFRTFVDSAIQQPDRASIHQNILGATERDLLLKTFNTTSDTDNLEPIYKRIWQQAQHKPDALAVVASDGCLTYQELTQKALNLATILQSQGVQADDRVGLLTNRTSDAMIGILGIWFAQAGYVPLDPTLPAARQQLMIKDSGIKCIVTQRTLDSLGLAQPDLSMVYLDELTPIEASDSTLDTTMIDQQLAYVIYTSGSTGNPKGVMVEHQQLAHYVQQIIKRFQLTEGVRFASVSTLSADLGHTALFPTLSVGGTLHLISQDMAANADEMASYMSQHSIDALKIVPSHLRALLSAATPAQVLPNTSLILGGEASDWALIKHISQLAPQCKIYNHYGPTETTVGVLTFKVDPTEALEASVTIPLGKPLNNTECYILDSYGEPVALGMIGELYLGGLSVTRGYLNQPGLTAERFVPHPWSMQPGARLYRTGDLARYRTDGVIEFLGRADDQVKVRGFRIELGEIKSVLQQHPAVSQSAVIIHKDDAAIQRIIGYIVPDPQTAPMVHHLLHLKQQPSMQAHELYTLPNGSMLVHEHRFLTDTLYKKIFEDTPILNLNLSEQPYIIDIGANIGLWSLWIGQQYPQAHIYAFEPIPTVASLARTNMELYGIQAKVFDCGIADKSLQASLAYYSAFSILPIARGSATAESDYIQAIKKSVQLDSGPELETVNHITCQFRTVSDLMSEEQLDRVDLLNISITQPVEQILAGIDDTHWPAIQQIVIETYAAEVVDKLKEMLLQKGYAINSFQRQYLGLPLFIIHAARTSQPTDSVASQANTSKWHNPDQLIESIQTWMTEQLPDVMVPSALVFIPHIPLTTNGKLDHRALPHPEDALLAPVTTKVYVAPRNDIEAVVADVWADILSKAPISIDADFFELGGHSLLATQLISRIRSIFHIEVPIRSLFDAPTVESFAANLVQYETKPGQIVKIAQLLKQIEAMDSDDVNQALNKRKEHTPQ